MKSIEIEVSFFKNEKHTVHLGNCEWLYFKSKRFLRDYLRTYKKVLLDNVRILNSYHLQAYIIYRTYYFDFDIRTTRRVEEALGDFTESYNLIFKTYSAGNHNAFIFNRLDITISMLSNAVSIIKRHAQLHKNYSIKHSTNTLLKMLSDLSEKIEIQKRDLNLSRTYSEQTISLVGNEKIEYA